MNITRKTVVFARHGERKEGKPGEIVDAITPESFERIYQNTGVPLQNGLTAEQVYLLHSNMERTHDTGATIVAGALDLSMPRSREDLKELDLSGLTTHIDPKLGYKGLKFDIDAFIEDPNAYLNWMMENRDATRYNSTDVTPYAPTLETGKGVLRDAVARVLSAGGKDLGVVVSHASIIESPVIAAINSGRSTPIERFEDIGGQFEQEDSASLHMDYDSRTGSSEAAYLSRNGQRYNVDVSKILSA